MRTKLSNLIRVIAESLVDDVNSVKVRRVNGDRVVVYELSVAKSDIGKVIGKNGRTAMAIRVIVQAASTRVKQRSIIEIIE